jgi:O-methyltransferase involved in polyketide biosynthesis
MRSAIDENGDLKHEANEPSRTALIIARQRAAHQVLDHGSILYDPFAMKILREDEEDLLQVLSHMRKLRLWLHGLRELLWM